MKCETIEAVLKVTERCNINCTYCYMFNMDSDLYESKPKQISQGTVGEIARMLARSANDLRAKRVRIIYHGGEPMMMRKSDFEEMCNTFVDEIQRFSEIAFSIQTNAMLIDDEWISIFEKYKIVVGVSIDGPKDINDIARVDHKGVGTYDRVIKGVKVLFDAEKTGQLSPPGALCVINPEADGGLIFKHLAVDIGFKFIDFLLPIETRETMDSETADKVGVYLEKVFRAWNDLNDKTINVRFFDKFYSYMTGYDRLTMKPLAKSDGNVIVSISTDGTYGPDDALRIVSDSFYQFDCRVHSLVDYLQHPLIEELTKANNTAPEACKDCSWVAFCLGGSNHGRVVNRYSDENRFENKSVLCRSLDNIYSVLAHALIQSGYDQEAMFKRLDLCADQVFAENA